MAAPIDIGKIRVGQEAVFTVDAHPGRQFSAAVRQVRKAPQVVLLSAWQNTDAHALFEALGFRRTMVEMTAEVEPAR